MIFLKSKVKNIAFFLGLITAVITLLDYTNEFYFWASGNDSVFTEDDKWVGSYKCIGSERIHLELYTKEVVEKNGEFNLTMEAAFSEKDRFDGATLRHGSFEVSGKYFPRSGNVDLKPLGPDDFIVKPKSSYTTIGFIGKVTSNKINGSVWNPDGYQGCKDFRVNKLI
ncbi:hypothetical protein OA92_22165 [Marinomonas sp. SBI22]|uniref:hypothetical protein n=1 Tax=unclassified Marinomonas TaxID=196814 RepID=UPI0007AFB419|nr:MULTISPECIES: hypothetical protein [unclassified Marinomonas]KZM38849.1 hypothetical protein OA92_22165 [Marinomonas sp. SBI22]KZM39471.1 hypothetical protein OA91_22015 [Marinomonas sp. SBI8L]